MTQKKTIEQQIESLHAETLAFQVILTNVLSRLRAIDPGLASAITVGLNDSANQAEDLAIRFGKTASPEHTVKAIRIVEELRTAVLGNQDKPRGGI
jgi:hypothetical protein